MRQPGPCGAHPGHSGVAWAWPCSLRVLHGLRLAFQGLRDVILCEKGAESGHGTRRPKCKMQRADSCLRGRTVSHCNSARLPHSSGLQPRRSKAWRRWRRAPVVCWSTCSAAWVRSRRQLGSRERESSAATLAARQLPPPTHRCRRLLPSRRQLPLMPSAPICWRGWRPALGLDLQRCMRCRPRTASAPRKCGSYKRWVQRGTERIAGLAAGCR